EKKVEMKAKKFIVIVDESKLVHRLGMKGPVPVELLKEGIEKNVQWLGTLCARAELWMEQGKPAETDNENYLAKCWFEGGIQDAYSLARSLDEQPGVFAHGLFLDMATMVIVAAQDGVKVMER
ncbi:MAG TPA: ribose-5-phosphate isomerase A, partial [Candidatus Gracilibacteria bacterium]|nr:ribose-5-phosphate isomerase A [Candidatus Gracilibacteria bacterium]